MEPSQELVEEPKGISFFSVKTGETHYGKLEPTIQAYINSSNMGINASRGQDFGWKLGAEWVKRVRAFRRDRTQMSILTAKNDGQKPTTVQILYFLYGEELANYYESMEENESPFEEIYQQAITLGITVKEAAERANLPKALIDFLNQGEEGGEDDTSDLIDNPIESEASETPTVVSPDPLPTADEDDDDSLDDLGEDDFLPGDPTSPPTAPQPDAPAPGGTEAPVPEHPMPEPSVPTQT